MWKIQDVHRHTSHVSGVYMEKGAYEVQRSNRRYLILRDQHFVAVDI
jgi:hypothetical protein